MRTAFCLTAFFLLCLPTARADDLFPDLASLYRLTDGPTRTVNALWGETPKERQFGEGRSKVVIADLKGPGIITMIHFALPATLKLNRDTLFRIYWDGEKNPSVEAPLTDFFCDPNGALERVDSALLNKKRGWNCYFPMPFAKSARVEVETDNRRYPNGSWNQNPCYSYVTWRPLKQVARDTGYFHARWRQETLLLGKRDYAALETTGRGQFVGWNMTIRGVGSPADGYPVDENVKFFVDSETDPSVEWQGLEDSFGFSWGFPEQANSFPFTGYQPWYNGAAAYRLTLSDRIPFKKSLRVAVGFGKNEASFFFEQFSLPQNPLQLSSVVYWYQKEPHPDFPPLPPARERRPALLAAGPVRKPADPHLVLSLNCGSAAGDEEYLKDGWDFVFKKGYSFEGPQWTSEIKHCWADYDSLEFDIVCPKGAAGTLRLYLLDGDNFYGGRRESVTVAGRLIGEYENFQAGRWVEVPISASDTANGDIPVVIKNLKEKANAVVSKVQFVEGER
jgi:hypothetical protein